MVCCPSLSPTTVFKRLKSSATESTESTEGFWQRLCAFCDLCGYLPKCANFANFAGPVLRAGRRFQKRFKSWFQIRVLELVARIQNDLGDDMLAGQDGFGHLSHQNAQR